MNNSLQDLVTNWKDRINKLQKAHYYIADRFEKYHYFIGLPATVLTAIAGATLFLDINQQWIKVAVGGVGLLAAILSAVQTFYSHAKRGEEHRTAGIISLIITLFISFQNAFNFAEKAEFYRVIHGEAKILRDVYDTRFIHRLTLTLLSIHS